MPLRPNAPTFVPTAFNPVQVSTTITTTTTTAGKPVKKKKPNKKKRQPKGRAGGGQNTSDETTEQHGSTCSRVGNEKTTKTNGRPNGTSDRNPKNEPNKKQQRKRNNHRKNPKAQQQKRQEDLVERNMHQEVEYQKQARKYQEMVVDLTAFPTLVFEGIPPHCLDSQADGGGGWANVAAKVILPESSEEYKERESLLTTSSIGSRLTLLGKDRGRSSKALGDCETAASTPTLSFHQPSSNEGESNNKNDAHDHYPVDQIQLETEESSSSPHDTSSNTALSLLSMQTRQPPRLDMPKLRDRWWNLMQKSAELKRQQKELDLRQLEEQRKLSQIAGVASSSDSDDEEEYVELRPLHHSCGGNGRNDHEEEHAISMDMDRLDKYLECSHPLHYAIMNHDQESLDALLKLPAESVFGLEANQMNHLNQSIVQWSPLQLAVKLDKPDLLLKLLRAVAALEDEARRRLSKNIDDSRVLQLGIARDGRQYQQFPTPLMMAVELGHEECAQILLTQAGSSSPLLISQKDMEGNNALHYCSRSASAGRATTPSLLRSLLDVAISAGGTTPAKVLSSRNLLGQTPLHVACQEGRVDLVEIFLGVCGSSSCFSVLLKVLAMKDQKEQTPLLAAIASGSTDLVMTLLMWKGNHHHHHLGTRQRQKASNVSIYPSTSSKSKEAASCCPLVWAITTSTRVDMVRLLLEFHAPTFSKLAREEERVYDLTHALQAVARLAPREAKQESDDIESQFDEEMLEIIQVLVEHGANPCEAREQHRLEQTSLDELKPPTRENTLENYLRPPESGKGRTVSASALSIAAGMGDGPILVTLLDSLYSHRKEVKESRRRDPILRKQPESFFRGLESMEESEMKAALSDALVVSLYFGYSCCSSEGGLVSENQGGAYLLPPPRVAATSEEYLRCGLTLFRKGARLGSTGLARLKCSLGTATLKRVDDVITSTDTAPSWGSDFHYNFRTGYSRGFNAVPSRSDSVSRGQECTLSMEARSELLCQLPWMKKSLQKSLRTNCQWICEPSTCRGGVKSRDGSLFAEFKSDLVALVTEHGSDRVVVHGSIVSQQSAKLAAAIRFARMSSDEDNADCSGHQQDTQMLEIDLGGTPTRLCLLMLQNVYHGSIVVGLSASSTQCCQDLLDLLLLAEEFLCPALTQECEMRLLSSNPRGCFCWSCNRATKMNSITTSSSEHVYIAEGPSELICAETVLDVVAVAQHLEGSQLPMSDNKAYALDFSIHLSGSSSTSLIPSKVSSPDGTSSGWTRLTSATPLLGIREVCACVLMNDFDKVLQSTAFASQVEASLSLASSPGDQEQKEHQNEAPSLLLHMCLDEIAASEFKEAWNVHSLSLKGFLSKSSFNRSSPEEPTTHI